LDGDLVRDEEGRVVGKVIGGNRIAIDTLAVLPDLVKQDEPRLCPAPASDVPGSDRGKSYEENRSRQYEDFLKLLINPPPNGPTPSGFAYYLPNPEGGKLVSFDDCKNTTGMVFEFKGYYGGLLTFQSQAVLDFWSSPLGKLQQAGDGRSCGFSPRRKRRNLLASSLIGPTMGASALQLCMCLGSREGDHDRSVL
jgi:hypothetical protein